jgi:hypothetical protein
MFRRRFLPFFIGLIALALFAISFYLPTEEDRLSYGRFVFLLISVFLSIIIAPILICPQQHRRYFGLRWGAVGIGGSVALVAVEIAFSLLPAFVQTDNPWYLSTGQALKNDPDLPWLRPPGIEWTGPSRGDLAIETDSPDPYARTVTFQTDWQGFRNAVDRNDAECIFIGDSFTEAGNIPIEQTFVQLVEDATKLRTRNLGIAGYGPPAELVVLEKFGMTCKPSTVVWQIAETNDLDDSMFFVEWQQAGRPDVLPGYRSVASSVPKRMPSPLRLLYDTLVPMADRGPFRGEFIDQDDQVHTMRFEMSFLPEADRHPGWRVMEYSITSGAKQLRDQGISLVVLLIPRKLRVMGKYCDFAPLEIDSPDGVIRLEHQLPEGWELPVPVRLSNHLSQLCERLEVPFVDATEALLAETAKGRMVYQPMDTHLTAEGHQIVARLLVSALPSVSIP